MRTQNDKDRARATAVLREASKTMEALKIGGNAAFEATVEYVAEWALQQERGEEILLNAAAWMQRRAIEQQVLARMVPAGSVN